MGTWNHKKTKLGYCIFVLAILYRIVFSCAHVDGKSIPSDKAINLAKHKGTIKTIQSEDGDIIDCVDIYKQPAFDHPLLNNHTIQMKPSSYPTRIIRDEESEPELFQSWHKNGQCPEGTIPIIRSQIHNSVRTKAFVVPSGKNNINDIVVAKGHEYAQVSVINGNYFGANAWLNVWNPATFDGEFSLAQIWVLSGHLDQLNALEAGWMTNSGQKQTKLFIHWTTDGYQNGCYNLDCPGFVQTSKKILLGANLTPVSKYGAKKQQEISIKIHKDKQSGNWWLRWQNIDLGYWPGSIFTRLSNGGAESINWGGEIVNSEAQGRHTSTQMGSGHFPGEGFGKASFFRNIGYVDESGAVRDAENLVTYVTRPECYDLQIRNKNSFGTHFYYGGPGFSDKCK